MIIVADLRVYTIIMKYHYILSDSRFQPFRLSRILFKNHAHYTNLIVYIHYDVKKFTFSRFRAFTHKNYHMNPQTKRIRNREFQIQLRISFVADS